MGIQTGVVVLLCSPNTQAEHGPWGERGPWESEGRGESEGHEMAREVKLPAAKPDDLRFISGARMIEGDNWPLKDDL